MEQNLNMHYFTALVSVSVSVSRYQFSEYQYQSRYRILPNLSISLSISIEKINEIGKSRFFVVIYCQFYIAYAVKSQYQSQSHDTF